MKAKISINKKDVISKVDPRIFGSFIEHLGRAVYGGIYEPGHPTADDMGFRKDVLELVKEINVPIVRYPGGNFVSGYNWEDGTGPKEKRPRKMELAWQSVETNEVGIDEFQEWCKRADTECMMAVNLGTRGPDEARQLLEYCNGTLDTEFAEKRRKNGFQEPFNIKTWCLGNEMDGPWQICHKTAYEYGRIANETAKVLKWTDPSVEVVACGSSSLTMPTFGEWERTVLRECYDNVDFMSLHNYYGNSNNNTPAFFTSAVDMDTFIKTVVGICDEIKAEKKSNKTINLSFDEWNVWFHSHEQDKKVKRWVVAPPLLEDIYTLEDAVVVGDLLITLLNNADRVKMACLAQLVNVIAPIMTENGGKVWAQTIFYPYMYSSKYGRGTSLKSNIDCPTYDVDDKKGIPTISSNAVISDDEKTVTVFTVNRSIKDECDIELDLAGFEGYKVTGHTSIEGDDLKAVNSAEAPDTVSPTEKDISKGVKLAPHSWNMITLSK
ncbi:MAG: alpha-N-arabinofuranosidase [Acutalibacteraceae bacterium]